MKLLPQFCFAVFASALMALALPVSAAHAFTLEGANTVTQDGSSNLDLTSPTSRLESANGGKVQIGGGTLQFHGRQQSPSATFYEDANRMFNPLGGPGESGRNR
ncbi:MAG TPA: hypothetical protein VFX37_13655 [Pseudolabrys sp.]|nr:hypothetical protein [Pseudolabrys sp.]